MHYYLPEYNEKTSMKRGEIPQVNDIMARARLIRELRGMLW